MAVVEKREMWQRDEVVPIYDLGSRGTRPPHS
jgi:hypothetical protein